MKKLAMVIEKDLEKQFLFKRFTSLELNAEVSRVFNNIADTSYIDRLNKDFFTADYAFEYLATNDEIDYFITIYYLKGKKDDENDKEVFFITGIDFDIHDFSGNKENIELINKEQLKERLKDFEFSTNNLCIRYESDDYIVVDNQSTLTVDELLKEHNIKIEKENKLNGMDGLKSFDRDKFVEKIKNEVAQFESCYFTNIKFEKEVLSFQGFKDDSEHQKELKQIHLEVLEFLLENDMKVYDVLDLVYNSGYKLMDYNQADELLTDVKNFNIVGYNGLDIVDDEKEYSATINLTFTQYFGATNKETARQQIKDTFKDEYGLTITDDEILELEEL